MSINCCYKCTERQVGCHDSCDKYNDYKLKIEEEKKRMKYENTNSNVGWGYLPRRSSRYRQNRR